ncbi:MAG: STAS domain-containing protein [Rhodococcus sp. (in: high G+C Gram-positive bacteria)]
MITAANPLPFGSTAMSLDEAPRYTVEVESYSPSYSILRASGDLDMSSKGELLFEVDRALSSGTDVVLDLSAVSFMYSGAANAVIDAASASDGRVHIFAPTRPVRMILDVLGAADLVVDHLPTRGRSL